MAYKPDGHTDVSAYMMVDDAEEMLVFLETTFGAKRLRNIQKANSKGRHAEARIGDSVVMIGEGFGAQPTNIHVYVPDVDAVYATALKAGATSVQAPFQDDDPDKRGGVIGPSGITWWFATQQ